MSGVISLELGASTVREDIGSLVVPVLRTGDLTAAASFDYSVTSGSAIAGLDFTANAERLTFASQQDRIEIQIPITQDGLAEVNETFNLQIGEPSAGAELGFIRTAIITLEDDDADAGDALRFSQAQYNVLESAGAATITVSRSDSSQAATVEYFTQDVSARAGSDYEEATGTLSFAAGEDSKTFSVPVTNDDIFEISESLSLGLRNPSGASLGAQSTANLSIQEEDASPHQFEERIIISGLDDGDEAPFSPPGPIGFDWAPDGTMFIAKLDGVIKLYDGTNLLTEPFIDISDQVNTGGQRGLLGMTLDPNFPTSPYVYLAFSYDPPGEDPDQSDVSRVTRVVRVTADATSDFKTAVPNSELILLETSPVDNFHAAGALKFGQDGSLYFTHGDGQAVGTSTGVQKAELLSSLDNPFGKMLRIDPATGEGLPDNPFYIANEPNNIQSKIYNYGLRNPWRYTLHPETDEPFIGDVGQVTWEEINRGAGHYFGWSLYEGGNGESLRATSIADNPSFASLYEEFDDQVVAPIYAENHADGARAIVLGDFYTGDEYPEIYQDSLIFADFGTGDVKALAFDDQGNLNSAIPFTDSSRGLSYMSTGPDGKFYFANIITGEIGVWDYVNNDQQPPATTGVQVKVEAEDITALAGYRIESNTAASGGQMLSLVGESADETGSATFTFTGESGKYNIVIGAFDENDGIASFELQQEQATIGSLLLNQQLGSNAANVNTLVERAIASEITINNGDSFTIIGNEESSEHARLDFIRFDELQVDPPVVEPSTSTPSSIAWDTQTGVVSVLTIAATTATASTTPLNRTITDTNWRLQTTGDLNGDGQDDVLLRQFAAGINLAWYMEPGGQAIQSEQVIGRTVEDPNWSIVGTGDLNADGKVDLLLRNEVADQIVAWYMDGAGGIESEAVVGRSFGDSNWKIEAMADFNGDDKSDIVLRHRLSGQNLLWEMDGANILAESLIGRDIPDSNWHIEGARDFDGNGTIDLFLRHQGVGQGLLWTMNDENTIGAETLVANVPTGLTQLVF